MSALDKLTRVCGMLGSDQPGERAAAALHADRLARQFGGWGQVLALRPPARPATVTAYPPQAQALLRPHQRRARVMLLVPHLMTAWELDFVSSVAGQRNVTQRQADKLDAIERDMARREKAA